MISVVMYGFGVACTIIASYILLCFYSLLFICYVQPTSSADAADLSTSRGSAGLARGKQESHAEAFEFMNRLGSSISDSIGTSKYQMN